MTLETPKRGIVLEAKSFAKVVRYGVKILKDAISIGVGKRKSLVG